MLKVILIDDEAIILQGLKKLIPWNRLGFEIVGEALDGQEGLLLIEEKNPDLVISDVAMPNLSGIEMLKAVSDNKNRKVIFLSGYQEFNYVRDAMRYGAIDYLLKPVSEEVLTKTLERIRDQIWSERSYHVLKKKDSPSELLFQTLTSQKRTARIEDFLCEWAPDKEGACCIALRIIPTSDKNQEDNAGLMRFEIYEFIQEYLTQHLNGGIIKKEYSTCYFVLTQENNRKAIKTALKKLSAEIRNRYPVNVIIGVGAWLERDGELSHLYKTAKFALDLYYFVEEIYIDYEAISRDYTHSLAEYEEAVKKLEQTIVLHYASNTVVEEIVNCVTLLGNIHYGNKNVIINNCILLSGKIFSILLEYGLLEETDQEEQTKFLEKIRKKVTFRSLISLFEDYYSQIFLKIKLLSRYRESPEIVRIKNYIEEHFKEAITLEEIADYIGMNASYMSVFFKKETGQNFKNYVTEVRMKHALKLLNSTNMKSYELAEAVGYRDAKQFREKFKELYGVSPQQYRKKRTDN